MVKPKLIIKWFTIWMHEPNRDLKKEESACEDPWYEQPRITQNFQLFIDTVLTEEKSPASATLFLLFTWNNSPPIATTKRNIA